MGYSGQGVGSDPLKSACISHTDNIETALRYWPLLFPVQEGTSGKTALHLAVELRDMTTVKLLLSRGANVDATMFNGCTPLHLAVGRQDAAIANLLCQSGADMMLRNMEDETALDLADGNDDVSCEEVLFVCVLICLFI